MRRRQFAIANFELANAAVRFRRAIRQKYRSSGAPDHAGKPVGARRCQPAEILDVHASQFRERAPWCRGADDVVVGIAGAGTGSNNDGATVAGESVQALGPTFLHMIQCGT